MPARSANSSMKDSIAKTFNVAPSPRNDEVRTGVSAIR